MNQLEFAKELTKIKNVSTPVDVTGLRDVNLQYIIKESEAE
jgi:hypothetical protein